MLSSKFVTDTELLVLQKKDFESYSDKILFRLKEANSCGLNGYTIIPFIFENKLFGLIELFSQEVQSEDPEMRKILRDMGSEIGIFIKHQQAQQRAENLQKQLIDAARQTGMSQVANSVLHNVGNALNSLNISANLLQENYASSKMHNLSKVSTLIKENRENLALFLTEDPQGKYLLDYIIALSDWWQNDQKNIQDKLNIFSTNIQNIKKIIKMQQKSEICVGAKEKISVNLILDDLLFLLMKDIEQMRIQVIKKYEVLPEVLLDRSLLVQILENLVQNAIDSLAAKQSGDKELRIYTRILEPGIMQIQVTDTGIGIAHENIGKIFSYGFTLKNKGHGFGLYYSASLAEEFGGKLSVESPGLNEGASFFLTFPVR